MSRPYNTVKGLGTLINLPAEIREMIWRFALGGVKRWTNDVLYQGSILTTSRAVLAEVRPIIYRNRGAALRIRIAAPAPADAWRLWPSEFGLEDKDGLPVARWLPYYMQSGSVTTCFRGTETRPHLRQARLVPRWLFPTWRIEIAAPRKDDPGQLVQSWIKLFFLARLLREIRAPGKQLPRLEVHYVETADRSWSTNGKLNKSVQGPDDDDDNDSDEDGDEENSDSDSGDDDDRESDLRILMEPLLRLRRMPSLTIDTTGITLDRPCRRAKRDVRLVATAPHFDGNRNTAPERLRNATLQRHEDTWSVWLDMILDDLPGPTAALVRLERLAAWDRVRSDNMAARCRASWLDADQQLAANIMLGERQCALAAFDPHRSGSVQRWRRRLMLQVPKVPTEVGLKRSEGRWRRDYREEGIPQTSSAEYTA